MSITWPYEHAQTETRSTSPKPEGFRNRNQGKFGKLLDQTLTFYATISLTLVNKHVLAPEAVPRTLKSSQMD